MVTYCENSYPVRVNDAKTYSYAGRPRKIYNKNRKTVWRENHDAQEKRTRKTHGVREQPSTDDDTAGKKTRRIFEQKLFPGRRRRNARKSAVAAAVMDDGDAPNDVNRRRSFGVVLSTLTGGGRAALLEGTARGG